MRDALPLAIPDGPRSAEVAGRAGGFITESSTRTLSSEIERGDAAAGVPPSYKTKLLVKLRLGLPWSPVLAWPWGVAFDGDTLSFPPHPDHD